MEVAQISPSDGIAIEMMPLGEQTNSNENQEQTLNEQPSCSVLGCLGDYIGSMLVCAIFFWIANFFYELIF